MGNKTVNLAILNPPQGNIKELYRSLILLFESGRQPCSIKDLLKNLESKSDLEETHFMIAIEDLEDTLKEAKDKGVVIEVKRGHYQLAPEFFGLALDYLASNIRECIKNHENLILEIIRLKELNIKLFK